MRDSEAILELMRQGMLNAGIDAEEVFVRLAKAGYVASWDGRFDHAHHVVFWQILEAHTGDQEIGLHLCPHLPLYRGRVFEYLFLSSPTYAEGWRAAFKYQRLVSDAFHLSLVTDEAGARIQLEGAKGDAPELRHTEACAAYAFLQITRRVTDGRFEPTHIRLWGRPRAASRQEYEDVFGCPVEFTGEDTAIWFDPELLKCSSPHSDPELLQWHRKYADNQLAQLARRDLMDDVYDFLKRQFMSGNGASGVTYTLADIAKEFGVSARHLRFVLSETGTTFRQLLKDARFGFACRELKKSREPVEEIALRAGFSEPSTFCRAFKQWTGLTPDQFRETRQLHRQPRARDRGHTGIAAS